MSNVRKTGSQIPAIRFGGYTDAWEQRKLIDVAYYRNGKAHEKEVNPDGQYIIVNSKFISTNGKVIKKTTKMIAPLHKNEIAFVLSDVPNGRAIARTFFIQEDNKYSLNQRIAGITPKRRVDSYFLNLLMNRNPYFLKFDDGVSQTNLSKSEVEKFIEFYPCYKEQNVIGIIFKKINHLIAANERKGEALQKLKKALLQRMFVSGDEQQPRVRFMGFTDTWEQRKLGTLVEPYSKLLTPKSKLPIATSSRSGLVLQSDYFNGQESGLGNETIFRELPTNYITYRHMSDDATFHFNCNNFDNSVLVSKEYPVFRFKVKSDQVAVIEYLNNSDSFLKFCTIQKKGGTRTRLYFKVLETFQMGFSNHIEMKKISNLLENMEYLIAANECKNQLLKEYKRALMQKMFV